MPRLCVPPTYQRHRPEDTVLYRTLEVHLEAFLARASDQGGGEGLPLLCENSAELATGGKLYGRARDVHPNGATIPVPGQT